MTTLRVVLIVSGLAIASGGAALLLQLPSRTIVLVAVWALAGVVVHDFVFAPASALLGRMGRRIVPGRWWTPVTTAALCTVILVVLAVPVYDTPGARPDNSTVLDRDYHSGLAVALILVWACVPAHRLITAKLARRRA